MHAVWMTPGADSAVEWRTEQKILRCLIAVGAYGSNETAEHNSRNEDRKVRQTHTHTHRTRTAEENKTAEEPKPDSKK